MSAGDDRTGAGATTTEAERTVARAAELLLSMEVLPGPAPLPDFDRVLTRGRRMRRHLRAWGLVLGGAAAAAGLMLLVVISVRGRGAVSYMVAGPVAISSDRSGDVIEAIGPGAAADAQLSLGATREGSSASERSSARVRFSEGTEVELAQGSRLRVTSRDANGAALVLDRGHAGLAVTHRRGARWSVATGPFTIDVVGTRFSVDWAPERERMVVELVAGKVSIRGASVGGPVEMHPGERLVASVSDQRVTLSPLVERLAPATGPGPGSSPSPSREEAEAGDRDEAKEPTSRAPNAGGGSSSDGRRRHAVVAKTSRAVVRRPELALASPGRETGSAGRASPFSRILPSSDSSAPTPPAAAAPRFELQPPPVVAPVNPTTTLGGGGVFCSRETAQYRFEQGMDEGISAASIYTLALANPERDTTHSWCGEGSVRLRANFSEQGRRNYFGRFLRETGQMVIRLDRPTDFTGRTLTMHVFVEGPPDARFSAEVFAVHRGHWVGSEPMAELSPGRWWTIKHVFKTANPTGGADSSNPQPYPGEGLSPVSDCNRISLAIRSTGPRRNWIGAVYVDDVGWR